MPRAKRIKIPEIISSDTVLASDRWLYRWTGEPPRDFHLFKTLFLTLSPADVVANGWQMLKPAVGEMAAALQIEPVAAKIDWLKLEALLASRKRKSSETKRPIDGKTTLPPIPVPLYESLEEKDVASDKLSPHQPPTAITADERLAKLWSEAGEDERFLAEALCELKARLHAAGVESYFRFADAWHKRYPKGNRKNYKRGWNSVKHGAAISPYSVSQIYCILKTIRVYSREEYSQLAQRATANGITITWTHLRTIAHHLGKPEQRRMRRKVEEQLVCRKMTEPQLK